MSDSDILRAVEATIQPCRFNVRGVCNPIASIDPPPPVGRVRVRTHPSYPPIFKISREMEEREDEQKTIEVRRLLATPQKALAIFPKRASNCERLAPSAARFVRGEL
jgi:hypothetical protein